MYDHDGQPVSDAIKVRWLMFQAQDTLQGYNVEVIRQIRAAAAAAHVVVDVGIYQSIGRRNPWDVRTAMTAGVMAAEFDWHPEWLLVDMDANPIPSDQGMTLLADVGVPGYLEACRDGIIAHGRLFGADTIYIDDCWPTCERVPRDDQFPLGRYKDRAAWEAAWTPFFKGLCDGIRAAGFKIIANCARFYPPYDSRTGGPWDKQASLVDGVIYETFSLDWGALLTPGLVNRRIQALYTDPMSAFVAEGAVPADQLDQSCERSLAMFLMSLPMSTSPERAWRPLTTDMKFWLHSMTRLSLGNPAEPPMQRAPWEGKAIWRREFTGGTVLLNYGPTPATFRLTNVRYDWRGTRYGAGSLTLPPYCGKALASRTPV